MNHPSLNKADWKGQTLPQIVWQGTLNHAAAAEVRVVLGEHETKADTVDLVVEVVRRDAMGERSFVRTEHESVKAEALRIALLHMMQTGPKRVFEFVVNGEPLQIHQTGQKTMRQMLDAALIAAEYEDLNRRWEVRDPKGYPIDLGADPSSYMPGSTFIVSLPTGFGG